MFMKLLKFIPAVIQLVAFLINKYNEKRLEDKIEKVRTDSAAGWADGFGVRRKDKSDPS